MTRKILKVFALVLTIAVGLMFYYILSPAKARDLTDLRIESTPERVARGEYLANNLLSCVHCHTRRDHEDYSLPAVGPAFAGGDCVDEQTGFPGAMCSPNITSDRDTGIGAWTDDELLRTIREGVDREGKALFPMMPFESYRALPDEDAYALIAYLRTVPPVSNSVPETVVNFPMNVVVNLLAEPLEEPVPPVSRENEAAYGDHIATVATCKGCHSGEAGNLAGGQAFPLRSGAVTAPNITPHETGVMVEDYPSFERMFRKFAPENEASTVTEPGKLTAMPWRTLAGLTDEDLRALFAYLRSIPAIDNPVQIYGE